MNPEHFAIYALGSVVPVASACLLQNKLTTGLRKFFAFTAVGAGFAMLNVGPLGLIIGGPSIVLSAALCAYLSGRTS